MTIEKAYAYHTSVSTYETTLRDHLGFRKNLKGSDWEAIGTHLEKRKGKASEVIFLGDRLDSKKIDKEVNRYRPRPGTANVPVDGKYDILYGTIDVKLCVPNA